MGEQIGEEQYLHTQISDLERELAVRRRTDEKVNATQVEIPESRLLDQWRKMLEKLRVHHIELVMQKERHHAKAVSEIARARYYDLYELAPVGYVMLSDQGLILQANLRTTILLGVPRDQLVKQPLSHFITLEDQDQYYACRKRFDATHESQDCELRMQRGAARDVVWVQLEMTLGLGDNAREQVCWVTLSDLTERKYAEGNLYYG